MKIDNQFVSCNLYQNKQKVNGYVKQDYISVGGNLFQNYQKVKGGNLYQNHQKVNGYVKQEKDSMSVGGKIYD